MLPTAHDVPADPTRPARASLERACAACGTVRPVAVLIDPDRALCAACALDLAAHGPIVPPPAPPVPPADAASTAA